MKRKLIIIITVFVLLLSACGSVPAQANDEAAPESMFTFADDLGEEISCAEPKRVAALIGSFADIWCLAGGKDTLVAAAGDAWTSFELELGDGTVNIGAVKEPNLELILAARPDLILASCATQADLDLRQVFSDAKLNAAYFDIQSFDDYLNMLKICTELTGKSDNYELYGERVRAEIEAAKARADGSAPRVLCMRATGASCKVKGSRDNLLGEMLCELGCVNIADSETSLLEELSLEAIIAEDPEYIFVAMQGSDPAAAEKTLRDALLSNPAWAELTAVKEGRFYTLENALYVVKPNERWGEAYEKLADILYPEK